MNGDPGAGAAEQFDLGAFMSADHVVEDGKVRESPALIERDAIAGRGAFVLSARHRSVPGRVGADVIAVDLIVIRSSSFNAYTAVVRGHLIVIARDNISSAFRSVTDKIVFGAVCYPYATRVGSP